MQNDSNEEPKRKFKRLCECGCGEYTSIAKVTRTERGQVRGQPLRFIHGHAGRHRQITAPLTGPAHPRWKGGVHMVKGYRKLLVGKQHPMADGEGYAYEHRLIAAATAGRYLERHEHVHHIDCDRTNNVPENLAVVTKNEHRRIHHMIDDSGIAPADALRRVLEQRT